MKLDDFVQQTKPKIDKRLKYWINIKRKDYIGVSGFAPQVADKLLDFSQRGKSIRGSLFLLSAKSFGAKLNEKLLDVAASLELIHSGLLIHDDVIDEDKWRRGKPSIYSQYFLLAEKEKSPKADHFSKSMAICVGDVAFFMAWEILASTDINTSIKRKMVQKIISELQKVGLSQMDDVYLGLKNGLPSLKQIANVYKYKTAGYTFSLPLTLGAIYNKKDGLGNQLIKLGEFLGIAFQIRDDEIALLSDKKIIGKPIGGDIKADKKTLWRTLLFHKASKKDQEFLKPVFGNDKLTTAEIKKIRELYFKYQINEAIAGEISQLTSKAKNIIAQLPIKEEFKNSLLELAVFIIKRER